MSGPEPSSRPDVPESAGDASPAPAVGDAAGVPLGVGTGTVASFDDPRGLGVVRGEGGHEYPFHCANIADGSRRIDPGARVSFRVAAGRQGRWEAVDIRPEPPAG